MYEPAPPDPLSDVLALLKPHSYMAGAFDLAGKWSMRFCRHQGIKVYAIVSGSCWLIVDGEPAPIHMQAGDCVLLPRGLPICITNDLTLPPVDAATLFDLPLGGRVATVNGGGELFSVGGHFLLSGNHAQLLLQELPSVVHIRNQAEQQDLHWLINRMRQEIITRRAGSTLVTQQLAMLIFLQALRLHLEDKLAHRVGWLSALADKQLNPAVTVMHEAPAHPWTLHELAHRCGLSRSIFALRFKKIVGLSPIDYLTRWRIFIAGDRLLHTTDPVASIAQSLGYDSQSAFTKVFRKYMGTTPTQFRQTQSATASH